MQAVFIELEMDPTPSVAKELEDLKEAIMKSEDEGNMNEKFDPEKHIDAYLPVRVNEQRVSNLLQSLLVGASLFAMPVIKKIPTSVLWVILRTYPLTVYPEISFGKLSAAVYYSCPAVQHEMEPTHSGNEENVVELSDTEILDELTTSRGELKLRSSISFKEDKRSQVHPDGVSQEDWHTSYSRTKECHYSCLCSSNKVWEIVAQFLNLKLDSLSILFVFLVLL